MSDTARQRLIIVDGHNLMHHDSELMRRMGSDFERARHHLVQRLECLTSLYERVVVVFDGRGEKKQSESRLANLEVVFSPSHLTADSVIERLVFEAADPSLVTVVTSDRSERDTVEAAGAASMGCSNFMEVLERQEREVRSRVRGTRQSVQGARLGDFFP